MLSAPTGCAAVNIGGATLHSVCALPVESSAVGQARDMGPSGQKLEVMRELWRKVGLLVIDEASMVSAEMLETIDSHLKTFRKSELPFGGISVVLLGDLYQLPPVNGRPIFTA
eukprot:2850696-Amphidinium_carterae.1